MSITQQFLITAVGKQNPRLWPEPYSNVGQHHAKGFMFFSYLSLLKMY